MREMQKENLFFFSFPSESNFGEARVREKSSEKSYFGAVNAEGRLSYLLLSNDVFGVIVKLCSSDGQSLS